MAPRVVLEATLSGRRFRIDRSPAWTRPKKRGTGTTTATIGSNVGNYPITGNFTSAAGYQIRFAPGTLAITPATLLFTAARKPSTLKRSGVTALLNT